LPKYVTRVAAKRNLFVALLVRLDWRGGGWAAHFSLSRTLGPTLWRLPGRNRIDDSPLEIPARLLYSVGGTGGIRMRKLWALLVAVALGLALGACSKCDVPDMLPKSCKTGTVGNEI
jgi:hypothetical protein